VVGSGSLARYVANLVASDLGSLLATTVLAADSQNSVSIDASVGLPCGQETEVLSDIKGHLQLAVREPTDRQRQTHRQTDRQEQRQLLAE